MADYFAGRMTHRRMSVLVRNLPRESALIRQAYPDLANAWSTTEHQLADIATSLRLRLYQAGGAKGKKPDLLRPPGWVDTEGHTMAGVALTADQVQRRLYGAGTAWKPETEEVSADG